MEAFLAPLALLAVFTGGAYYMLVPFLSQRVMAAGDESTTRTASLELRKLNLYEQIREVEFEREMGLINAEDFHRTRAELVAEAAQVIGEIDRMIPLSNPGPNAASAPPMAGPGCPACEKPLDPGERFCSNCGAEVGVDCPSCGEVAAPGDRFCTRCGRGLLS